MARFYIENFGCRATQADGAALERQFLERGLERAGTARDAEIVVLNTCTVTEGADKDARASIRRLRRVNPDCRILVTGCYAQRAPEELAALPGVTWVVGNSHKHQAAEIATSASVGFVSLAQLSGVHERIPPLRRERESVEHPAERAEHAPNVVVGDIFAHTELLAAPVFEAANERTRPNLKVQDGCNNRCSFCVIPYVRGQSRSLPMERVLAEVRTLVEAGYREVVISGINLGRWGRDLESSSQLSAFSPQLKPTTNDQRLVVLIRAVLEQTSLQKLRISSVEPMDWSDELIDLVATSSRIAKHAHVPMQSGSDPVLRRMHRKYRPWHYREKILKIRSAMPASAIGADVMVGFPGETEAEFDETRRMIEELPFTYLHVFTYSARPGTPAAEQPGQVPAAVARERNRVLREIASKKKAAFMRSLVGTVVEAITLQTGGADFTEALTENYLKTRMSGRHEANRWMNVKVEEVNDEMLVGCCQPGWTLRHRSGQAREASRPPASVSGVHESEQSH
ncbi:MAG: tRNA (N(6)-L-threonylcarbamoyladenosine(37)-C(2))-methylthiotransferase MtaB [Acidobacteriia bacterium]|nr:tRNA (N(6)-L-threonylcarbamoyladenosine(37)-C(2))-methylthiotransferase MtaB [Terriglobia bacterium]